MVATSTHRVALITGASSGIGAQIARELAAQGYALALAARRRDALESLGTEIRTAGGAAVSLTCDVTNPAEVALCVDRALAEFGRIDVLINNAGVMHNGLISGANIESWRAMIDVNLMGPMLVTHAVLPHMQAQKRGHIINMSSIAAKYVGVGNGIYNVSKWGLAVFSESLRQEVVRDNIKVSVVSPGITATELFDKIGDPAAREEFRAFTASLEDPLSTADIAHAVAYILAQPEHVTISEVVVRPATQQR